MIITLLLAKNAQHLSFVAAGNAVARNNTNNTPVSTKAKAWERNFTIVTRMYM